MIRHVPTAILVVLFCVRIAGAQDPAKPAGQIAALKPAAAVTALMVDVTLSRHLGEKRVSSTPYSVAVIPDQKSSLRMGGDVPVPTTTLVPGSKEEGKEARPAQALSSYGYRSVGTNIDVFAGNAADGQYRIGLTVEDTSIYPQDNAPATALITGVPAFRRFSSSNTLLLRDGQSLDYTMATDRLSGEVYRVTVKLTVVK